MPRKKSQRDQAGGSLKDKKNQKKTKNQKNPPKTHQKNPQPTKNNPTPPPRQNNQKTHTTDEVDNELKNKPSEVQNSAHRKMPIEK